MHYYRVQLHSWFLVLILLVPFAHSFVTEQVAKRQDLVEDLAVFYHNVRVLMCTACDGVVDNFLEEHKIISSHKVSHVPPVSEVDATRLLPKPYTYSTSIPR